MRSTTSRQLAVGSRQEDRSPAYCPLRTAYPSLLLALLLALAGCGRDHEISSGEFRGAPVILISIDTLRSDRLPVYGYANIKTPVIDALAADGIVFERAYSNVPLTLPSHTSILTGLLPPEHGVRNNVGFHYDVTKHPAITTALRNANYKAAAAVSAYVLRGNTGLSDAFDFYDDAIGAEAGVATGRLQRPGTVTLNVAQQWIDRNAADPFFLLFHIFEPHSPHVGSYDDEVVAADVITGKLFEYLKAKGLYDKSVIILLSDHGEGLGDHGEEEHGVFLYREALQVPLIVKLPGSVRRGERVATLASLIDVAPTIAFLAGVDHSSGKGINLFDPDALAKRRAIYSETLYPRIHLGWSELRSLVDSQHHYIEAPKPELYDLGADAAERSNVLNDQRRVYASLRDELAKYSHAAATPATVDPEEAKKLEALGYLGSIKSTEGPLPDPKDHIQELRALQQAARLAFEGRNKEAAESLRGILSANPRFSDAWAKLGSVYEALGQNEKAIQAYGEGIRAAPSSAAEFALSMAELYVRLHRFEDAKKHAELALAGNPSGAHESLARIALESGDLALAERESRAAATTAGTVILARIHAAQGRFDDALHMLEQLRGEAASKQMHVEGLEFALGDLYAKMNRFAEAEQAFRNEIAMFPSDLQAYSSLAVVLVVQKKYDAVDPVLTQMAENNRSPQAYLVAAKTYAVLGDARTAAQWRNRAAQAQ